MAGEIEPAKLLLPYLQRADELQKHEPLVSYYCRLYAMERGLRIPHSERTKTTNALLISLMNQLEKDKKSLKLGPDDNLHVEGFALSVFAKADKQDRAGRADLNTAKTFYAASIFFEILNQFGVPQPDIEQKQKYAVWKAADIRKAVKEGRKPIAGPPAGDDDLSIPSSGAYEKGPDPSEPIDPRYEPSPSQFHDPPNNDQHSVNVPPPVRFHDTANEHNSTNVPPPFQYHDRPNGNHSTSAPPHHFPDDASNYQHPANTPPPPRSYSSSSYSPHDFPPPPSGIRPENSDYSQPFYGQESLPQPPPQHLPHNYPPPDTSPNSFAHFQSYPSFSESTIPAVSSNFSYFQGSDAPYVPPPVSHQPAPQVRPSISQNGSAPEPAQVKAYEYDCNFQPAPEKIADAQKAARFAVGALAFDEVSVAVAHLTKALELLTKPS